MDLTTNEKRLLVALAPLESTDPPRLAELLSVPEDAAIQYAYLLQDRGLAFVERRVVKHYALTDEGQRYAESGLPERQLLDSFSSTIPLVELTRHPLAKIGIGQMRRKGWITIRDGMVEKTGTIKEGEDESALRDPVEGKKGVADLLKRGLLQETEEVSYQISITDKGLALSRKGIEIQEETGTLTRDQIISGGWKDLR